MSLPRLSKRRSEVIANGAFLIILGILAYTEFWWPGILLAVWANVALRQFFSGRIYDLFISTVVLLGLFFITILDFERAILLPVLFVVGGIYIIFREYCFPEDTNGEETSQEILDDTDNDKST